MKHNFMVNITALLLIGFFSGVEGTPGIDRPHANCYWVEQGRFLAGEYPAAADLQVAHKKLASYLDAGINYFLDLTEEHESSSLGPLRPYEALVKQAAQERGLTIYYKRMPICDNSVPRTREEMAAIIKTVGDALAEGHTIYVHCWGGIGRTGTVVACYLVNKGMTGSQALHQLAEWWSTVAKSKKHPRSPSEKSQRKFVKKFKI